MPIFETNYEKNTEKQPRSITSIDLPDCDAEFLLLYAICKKTSISAVHRLALKEWKEGNGTSVITLLHSITAQAQRAWYHTDKQNTNYEQFLNNMTVELHQKGICMKHIDFIKSKLKK